MTAVGGSIAQYAELDPTNADAGTHAPLISPDPPNDNGTSLLPYPSFMSAQTGLTRSYRVDGIVVSAEYFMLQLDSLFHGSSLQMAEYIGRASAPRLRNVEVVTANGTRYDYGLHESRAIGIAMETSSTLVRNWLVNDNWAFASMLFPQNSTIWPKFPTIENFTRANEGKILDALAVIFSKQCSQAYEHWGIRSPTTISNTRGAVIRPAEVLRNRSAADLALSPETYRDAQAKVNTGQAGTVFGADGRLQIYLHHTAFAGESIAAGRFSLEEALAHEFIHEALAVWRSFLPGKHDLAGWDGYKPIIEACK